MTEKKSFWTSIPGILTGFAALITALTAGYIALNPGPKNTILPGTPADLAPSAATVAPSPSDWSLMAEETFTKELSGWYIGNYPSEETPRFDLRLVDGRYRWDLEFSKKWHRWIICPIGSAIDFSLAVDVKLTEHDADTSVSLIFSAAGEEHYRFNISANRYFGLTKLHAGKVQNVIDWTPLATEYEPKGWNRMSVVTDRQLIRLYLNSELLGEYRDIAFTGGKVGLGVAMYRKGAAVVDFDRCG
jgi:hypothetical protein